MISDCLFDLEMALAKAKKEVADTISEIDEILEDPEDGEIYEGNLRIRISTLKQTLKDNPDSALQLLPEIHAVAQECAAYRETPE